MPNAADMLTEEVLRQSCRRGSPHGAEATYAPTLAVVAKGVTAPCDNLVGVCLVSYIPYDAVLGVLYT